MNIKITAVQDTDGDGDHRFILDREFQGTGVNSFHIANSGNYQLTIDKDNKVGMGVNNPSDFNSEGDRLVIGDGAGAEGMTIYGGTSSSVSILFADGTAGSAAYAGWVQYRHQNERLDLGAGAGRRVSINGNGVGIGTYNPDAKLDVSGAYSDSLAIFRNGAANVKVEITDDADIEATGWISSHNTGTSRIYTSEIVGDVSANGLVMETDGAGNRTRLANYGTATDLLIESKGSSSDIRLNAREAIRFYTSGSASSYTYGTEQLTITEGGLVGIGTDTPSYELDVVGTTRSTYYVGGAYFEENASDNKIKFYPNGTVLVLDKDGALKPCEKENDSFVFGVSKRDFDQPIVLGAEPVLVTGPIKVGDYIVTSDKQGHGQATKEPKVGSAIAQAMENGDGESYNIKAMIRKM